MAELTGDGKLELEVTDFGPIIEAKLDLRPLTVFVGPSNTGKSYLAILIYALHRVFGGTAFIAGRYFRGRPGFPLGRGGQDLSKESSKALLELVNSLVADSESSDQNSIVLPPPAADALRSGFNELADTLSDEIRRCFGIGEVRSLTRKGQTSEIRIAMRRRIGDQSDPVVHRVSFAQEAEFTTMVPAGLPIPINFGDRSNLGRLLRRRMRYPGTGKEEASLDGFAIWEVLQLVGDMVLPSLVGPLHLPAYYLPADRTGVMHAHSVVVSALIASAPVAGLRPAVQTPMLSGVLADFLEQLIEIDRFSYRPEKTERDLGRNIENLILRGSVRIERSPHVGYPRFTYRPHGWKDDLALANASSMVSELAPVVLYLRHMIKPGNILIVEEPESHLHPAMQVEFTRQLAALVEAGVRVIVTTHSEWLLEELANIVRRSQVSKAERNDDRHNRVALRPDQVGAWLFEPRKRPKGSVIKEIPIDDSGLYPSGYDDVARVLHNEWADITSQIEGNS